MNNIKFWDQRYTGKRGDELGWYESESTPSLNLINQCKIKKNELILDIGSGASVLIDDLLYSGYTNVIATDISSVALNITKERIVDKDARVQFIVDDITSSHSLAQCSDVKIWHDRATLHFLTKEKDRNAYLNLLNKILSPSGNVIIATFSVDGLKQCSGLDIRPYRPDMLSKLMGNQYKLLHSFNYDYYTPWGEHRPFIYTLFKKQNLEE